MSGVSQKVIDGAAVLMNIFDDETKGPAGKTGLSGEVALALGRKVSPRDFADMVHYCRRVLGPQAGRAVVYNPTTDQYGFAEDIDAAEQYIIARRNRDQATRAETLSAVCGAAMAHHGVSIELSVAKAHHDAYATQLRSLTDSYVTGIKAERAAKRLGVDAEIRLEERVA